MKISLKDLMFIAIFMALSFLLWYHRDCIKGGDINSLLNRDWLLSKGSALKRCVLGEMPSGDVYGSMERVVNNCVERCTTIRNNSFLQLKMGRFNEVKYFLPTFKKADISECKWLTIGIGGDTMVEKAFLKKYEKCQVFGIEASLDQYSDFKKFGTIIPHAVGPSAGNISMRLRLKNEYLNTVVPVKPLAEVLDDYLGTRLVHFATIDIEGGEFELVNALRRNKLLDREKVVFCQMDVEFHFAEVVANRIEFKNFNFSAFWTEFLRHSPYVPVFAVPFYGSHRKVTFVHAEDAQCEEFFSLQRYFLD